MYNQVLEEDENTENIMKYLLHPFSNKRIQTLVIKGYKKENCDFVENSFVCHIWKYGFGLSGALKVPRPEI